ncbi:hypothetical protein I6G79_30360 [Burkholderia plantarii]|nr:hypothetical protein [Burkholderia plantarii]
MQLKHHTNENYSQLNVFVNVRPEPDHAHFAQRTINYSLRPEEMPCMLRMRQDLDAPTLPMPAVPITPNVGGGIQAS